MDVLYRLGRATAGELMSLLPGSPSNSTVRTQLRVLESKGYVRHQEHGLRYIYMPTVPRHFARRSALKHLVDTFFDGFERQRGGRAARRRNAPVRRGAGAHRRARAGGERSHAMMVLADLAVRSSIVLALGLAIRAALRGRSAALRHRVLAATFFAAASVAPLGYILPAWSVPRSPRSVPATTTVAIETFRQTPMDRGTGSTVPPSALPLAAIVWSTGFGAGMAFLVLGIRRLEAIGKRAERLWSELDAARRTHFDGLRSETARRAASDRRTQSPRDVGIAPVARAPADACSVRTEP